LDFRDSYNHLQKGLVVVNNAIRDEEVRKALLDLKRRVQDWKNLKVETFGRLLLFDANGIKISSPDRTNMKPVRFPSRPETILY
jgi:hypothetical protein